MDNLIKPFYVYSGYYTKKGVLDNHRSQIISHCLEDLDKGIFTLPDANLEVSYNIRCDYNLEHFAFKTTCIVDLKSAIKLNCEEFYTFYDKYKQSKDVILWKFFGSNCYIETDDLLNLILVNWDEWN